MQYRAVLDIRPGASGVAAAREPMARLPPHAAELEKQRLDAIVADLILVAKRGDNAALKRAIRVAAAATSDNAPSADGVRREAVDPARVLSKRECEVLRLLTDGSRSPCIAADLNICVATVEVHRRNIMRKLGLHSVAALTKYALREGLTSL